MKQESNPKWVQIFRWSVQIRCTPTIWNCQWQQIKYCVRAHSKWSSELGQVSRWSEQLGQLVRWSAHWDQIYPPIWNYQWQQIKYCLIYVFSESPFKMVIGKFSDEVNNEVNLSDKVHTEIRYPPSSDILGWRAELCQAFRWSEQLGQLVRWSAHWDKIYPPCSDISWERAELCQVFRWSEQLGQLFR